MMNWSRVFNATMLVGVIVSLGFTSYDWWMGAPVTFGVWCFATMFLIRTGFSCVRDFIRGVWA